VTWTVGPRRVIEAVASAGSFLDGGGSRPLQRAAIPLLDPDLVAAETRAIRDAFVPKRELMLRRAAALGMVPDREPEGTFYAFVSLRDLPAPLADGHALFRAALEAKVITVPGVFFDINPGRRRSQRLSRFRQHLRLSFGPPIEEVERGLDRLEAIVRAAE
jgi:aspartate/methionine/tyrosine aminotransferase